MDAEARPNAEDDSNAQKNGSTVLNVGNEHGAVDSAVVAGSRRGEKAPQVPRRVLFITIGNSTVRLVTYVDRRAIQDGLGGNRPPFEEIADRILNKTPTGTDVRTSYDSEQVGYHVQVHRDLIYLVVCIRGYPRQLAFELLQKVQDQFEEKFSVAELRKMTKPDGLNASFRGTLKAITQSYTTRRDKITQLREDVKEVHTIMQQNIEDALERGERLDNLVEQADELRDTASAFHRQSGTLKKRMCQRNVAAASCIIVLVLLIILAIVLGVVLTHRN